MPIANYTTDVPVSRSIEACRKLLVDAGAEYLSIQYSPGAISLLFVLGERNYILPARWQGVKRVMDADRRKGETDPEQAKRVAWRHIHDWLRAQIAMVQSGQVEAREVLMPYELIEGETVFNLMEANRTKLLGPPGPGEG